MPAIGVAMEEGLLLRWLKAVGDPCAEGEPIVEIETDKTTMELESPATGVIASILFRDGDTVPVGTVIALVDDQSEGRSA